MILVGLLADLLQIGKISAMNTQSNPARGAAGPGLLRGAAGLSPAPDVLVVRHQPAGTYTANIALAASTLACLL
jgi:hypothetical protein